MKKISQFFIISFFVIQVYYYTDDNQKLSRFRSFLTDIILFF